MYFANVRTDWKQQGLNQIGDQQGRNTVFIADALNETNKIVNNHTATINDHGIKMASVNQTIQNLSQSNQNNSNKITAYDNQFQSMNKSVDEVKKKITNYENQSTESLNKLKNQMAKESKARINYEEATNLGITKLTTKLNDVEKSIVTLDNNQTKLIFNLKKICTSIEKRVVKLENNVELSNRVDCLENELILEINKSVNLLEAELANGRFKKLESKSENFEAALEKEKKEHESTKDSLKNLTATLLKLEQQFQSFQEMTKAKEEQNEKIIEQLQTKLAIQAESISQLTATAVKSQVVQRLSGEFNRRSGEFKIGNQSGEGSQESASRKEKFLNRLNDKKEKFTNIFNK